MSEAHSHFDVKSGTERGFGFVFCTVFLIIAAWPLLNDGAIRLWAVIIAAVFFVCALAAPSLLKPLNRAWFRFGLLLGKIVAPIVMAILFFIVVTPFAVVMRLFGRKPLALKFEQSASSYWIKRDSDEAVESSMRNQF